MGFSIEARGEKNSKIDILFWQMHFTSFFCPCFNGKFQEGFQKELALEQERRDREISLIAKNQKEQLASIERNLALEKAEKDRQIELTDKAREAELAEINRNLARERAEKEKDIELSTKEKERQESEIARATAVMSFEEQARDERHAASEQTALSMRQRALEMKLAILELDKSDAIAGAKQEQAISNEKAKVLAEQQKYILDRRWEVEKEEIDKEVLAEKKQIEKDTQISEENKLLEAAEIHRTLAREQEERDREIALVEKAQQLEQAEIRRDLARQKEERDRQIALVAKDSELRQAETKHTLAGEMAEKDREIILISKEKEREQADIRRFLSRELEERDREINLVSKTEELEKAQIQMLGTTAQKEQAEHRVDSVRLVADAERSKELDRIGAEKDAETRRIDEENKAEVTRMHMITQSEARKLAAEQESSATIIRAKATSEAQKITADGIEREAGAHGRAEMEIESLRAANAQRMLEAEANGIEAKAGALKKYNEAATFLELAKMYIEAERDVHIDQAKAMGNALQNAQIRMYGGGGSGEDGTMETIRGLFTQGFGLGEILEGFAQALPEGLRQRFNSNGLRGLIGRPYTAGSLREVFDHIDAVVQEYLRTKSSRNIPFPEALGILKEHTGDIEAISSALKQLADFNENNVLDDVSFDTVWTLIQAAARKEQ